MSKDPKKQAYRYVSVFDVKGLVREERIPIEGDKNEIADYTLFEEELGEKDAFGMPLKTLLIHCLEKPQKEPL